MKIKLLALTVSGLLLLAVPASADHRAFVAEANATALQLSITPPGDDPQGLTFGATGSLVQSESGGSCPTTACASAAAAVEPFGERAAVAPKNKRETASAEGFTAPEGLEPLLSGALGVATVAAEPAPDPLADAEATAGQLEINAVKSLLGPLQEQLDDGINQIVDGLEPILTPIEENDPTDITPQVELLIRDLVDALAENPLATVEVGASTAAASDVDETALTQATATAQGVVVELAPVPSVAPDGLFRVEVGAATASVQSDGTKVTKSSKGSVARLFVADLTTPEADDYQEVDIATDQPEQCFGESPLLLCIIVGGTADNSADGATSVTAAAVRIKAFGDAESDPEADNPLPGITLAVAEANAALNTGEAVVEVIEEPVPVPDDPETPPGNLPATGSGLGALGLAVLGVGALAARGLRRR